MGWSLHPPRQWHGAQRVILFVGTSAGPLLATSSPTFRTLVLILTGILAVALAAITGFKALADADH